MSRRFVATSTDIALGTHQLWRPSISLDGLRLQWTAPPPEQGQPRLYVVLLDDRDGGLVWAFESGATEVALDLTVLKAGVGAGSVVALAALAQQDGVLVYRSPRRPVRVEVAPAASAPAACAALGSR